MSGRDLSVIGKMLDEVAIAMDMMVGFDLDSFLLLQLSIV